MSLIGQWEIDALCRACAKGDVNLVRDILCRRENIIDKTGCIDYEKNIYARPLYWAVIYNKLDVIKCLVEKKAEIDYQPEGYRKLTVLMESIFHGYSDIAILLIRAGADVNIVDEHSRSAVDLAELYNRPIFENMKKVGQKVVKIFFNFFRSCIVFA